MKLDWEAYYSLPEGIDVQIGDRVRVNFAYREYVGVVSNCCSSLPPDFDASVLPILGPEPSLPSIKPQELKLWRALAEYYLCTVGEVYKAAYPNRKIDMEEVQARKARRLEARMEALQAKVDRARSDKTRQRFQAQLDALRSGAPAPLRQAAQEIALSAGQEKAFEAVRAAFENGKTVLLEGVTGSGKTEIYLQLAARCMQEGKSVLYLVPEIALSSQLEDRVSRVFPQLLLYHSALTALRKQEVAEEVREEAVTMVLGTRSALFLPHWNLGLVIVDEEHDTSYKQDAPAPRYHARETAIMLAGIQGASVILGSATPSLESLYNAQKRIFTRVELKERFYNTPDAEVQIIDTIAERRKRGMSGSLSYKLLEQIQRTLAAGEQAILLRSRRSYAPAVQCDECGQIVKCPHCNVPLSLHLNPQRLICHYCGYTRAYTGTCQHCGGTLQPMGAGTQKIEEELRAAFPEARIERLDSDNAADEKAIVRRFAKGETDILVGTQIVTKGFDFENLTLVGIIQADNILGQQNFRADERAFQLLEQFSGRSGRRGRPGLFVIQTREPAHPVFGALLRRENVAESMLQERQLFHYPPYTRLIHIVLKDKSLKRLDYMSTLIKEALVKALPNVPVVGPYVPQQEMLGGEYYREIRLMLARDKNLKPSKQILARTVQDFCRERKYDGHLYIDVDPV